MKIKKFDFFIFTLVILTAIVFIYGLVSVFTFRQLTNDGSRFAFRALILGDIYSDWPHMRYTTNILRFPSLIASWLNFGPRGVTIAFCFT